MANIRVNVNIPKGIKMNSQINDMNETIEQMNAKIDSYAPSSQTKTQTETMNMDVFTKPVEEYQKSTSTVESQQTTKNENMDVFKEPLKQYENTKMGQSVTSGEGKKATSISVSQTGTMKGTGYQTTGGTSFNQGSSSMLGGQGNMKTSSATSTLNAMSGSDAFKERGRNTATSITDSTQENREGIAHGVNVQTEIEEMDSVYQVEEHLNESMELYGQELEQQIKSYQEIIAHIEEQIKKYEELGYNDGGVPFKEYYESYQKALTELEWTFTERAVQYQGYCSEEKLQELGVTQEELSKMSVPEIVELCKKKDSEYLKSLGDVNTLKEFLDQEVKAKTGLGSYEEYVTILSNLQTDLANCNAALYQTMQLKKAAKYQLLRVELEDKEIEAGKIEKEIVNQSLLFNGYAYEIDYKAYQNNGGTLSPLEFLIEVKETYPEYEIKIEDKELLEHFLAYGEQDKNLIKIYLYLAQNGNKELAQQYLEDIQSDINNYIGYQQALAFLKTLKTDQEGKYNYKDIVNHFKVSRKGFADGVEMFGEGMINFSDLVLSFFNQGKEERIYSVNEYESMYILQALQQGELKIGEENSQEEITSNPFNLLDNNYEISQSIGNMTPSMAVGLLLTPIFGPEIAPMFGTATMGASAAGGSYHQALVEGRGKWDAIFYGILSGLSEATLEYALGAIPGLSKLMDENIRMTFKEFCKRMVSEGIEEGTQEWIDGLLKTGLFGDEFNVEEISKNSLKSALYGAITAMIMNGAHIGMNQTLNFAEQSFEMSELGKMDIQELLGYEKELKEKLEGKETEEYLKQRENKDNKKIDPKIEKILAKIYMAQQVLKTKINQVIEQQTSSKTNHSTEIKEMQNQELIEDFTQLSNISIKDPTNVSSDVKEMFSKILTKLGINENIDFDYTDEQMMENICLKLSTVLTEEEYRKLFDQLDLNTLLLFPNSELRHEYILKQVSGQNLHNVYVLEQAIKDATNMQNKIELLSIAIDQFSHFQTLNILNDFKLTNEEYELLFNYIPKEKFLDIMMSGKSESVEKILDAVPLSELSFSLSDILSNRNFATALENLGIQEINKFNQENNHALTVNNVLDLDGYCQMYQTNGDFYSLVRDALIKQKIRNLNLRLFSSTFKNRNSDLYLPDNAPLDLQAYYYRQAITPMLLIEHPEWVRYLENTSLYAIRVPNITTNNGNAFFVELQESLGFHDAMDIILEYAHFWDKMRIKFTNALPRTATEIKQILNRELHRLVTLNDTAYNENIVPQSFKKQYPELFLPEDMPQDLKEKFYHREFSVEDYLSMRENNPELFSKFEKVDITISLDFRYKKFSGLFENNVFLDLVDKYWNILDLDIQFLNYVRQYKKSTPLTKEETCTIIYDYFKKSGKLYCIDILDKFGFKNSEVETLMDYLRELFKVRPELNLDNPALNANLLTQKMVEDYGYPILNAVLEYNSGADQVLIQGINENDTLLKEWVSYIQKLSIYDKKFLHHALLSYENTKTLIKDILDKNIKLNDAQQQNLLEIISENNQYHLESVEDLNQYMKKRYEALQKGLNSSQISTVKDSILKILFNSSLENMEKTFQEYGFSEPLFIDEILVKEKVITPTEEAVLQIMNMIHEETDITKLREKFQEVIKLGSIETTYSRLCQKVRKYYGKLLADSLFKDSEHIKENGSGINYSSINGMDMAGSNNIHGKPMTSSDLVKVVELKGIDFKLLVHKLSSFDFTFQNYASQIIKNPALWNLLEGASTISTSMISNNHMNTVSGNNSVFYGFNEISDDALLLMGREDIFVEHGGRKLEPTSRINEYMPPDVLQAVSTIYNEIALDRKGSGQSAYDGRIQPNCIVCFDQIDDASITAAQYFDIPIYLIDKAAYLEKTNNQNAAYRSHNITSFSKEDVKKVLFEMDGSFTERYGTVLSLIDEAVTKKMIHPKTAIQCLQEVKKQVAYYLAHNNSLINLDIIDNRIRELESIK